MDSRDYFNSPNELTYFSRPEVILVHFHKHTQYEYFLIIMKSSLEEHGQIQISTTLYTATFV